jgi:hypothetical protein
MLLLAKRDVSWVRVCAGRAHSGSKPGCWHMLMGTGCTSVRVVCLASCMVPNRMVVP